MKTNAAVCLQRLILTVVITIASCSFGSAEPALKDLSQILSVHTDKNLKEIKDEAIKQAKSAAMYPSNTARKNLRDGSTKDWEVIFEGTYTPTEDNLKLSIFSDDRSTVWIKKDEPDAQYGKPVHTGFGKGSHLPNIPKLNPEQQAKIKSWQVRKNKTLHSFFPIDFPLEKDQRYKIKVHYGNLFLLKETDIDGCALFVYKDFDYIIVVSGFEPFGARKENTSSVIAKEIKKRNPNLPIELLEIPVIWKRPNMEIQELVKKANDKKNRIKIWLALGEGAPAKTFKVESLAVNERANARDNNWKLPPAKKIVAGGPGALALTFPGADLVNKLKKGFRISLSSNAGSYVCEEMLYNLLHEEHKTGTPLKASLFIHVPVLTSGNKGDDALVDRFSDKVLNAVLEIIEANN